MGTPRSGRTMRKGELLSFSSFAFGSIPARFNLTIDPLVTPIN